MVKNYLKFQATFSESFLIIAAFNIKKRFANYNYMEMNNFHRIIKP